MRGEESLDGEVVIIILSILYLLETQQYKDHKARVLEMRPEGTMAIVVA